MSTWLLLWGVLFSALGFGYFLYGKRQRLPVPLVCGLLLMVVPYFLSNSLLLFGVGATLLAVPYFMRDR